MEDFNPPGSLDLSLIDRSIDEPEVIRAMEYIAMKENRMTMQQIASHFKYSTRQAVYDLVARWEDGGILAKARRLWALPKFEDMHSADLTMLDSYPEMIDRMRRIVLHGREHNAIEAFKLLHEKIFQPALDAKEDMGSAERNYADKAGQFNPHVITVEPTSVTVTEARPLSDTTLADLPAEQSDSASPATNSA